MRRAITTIVLIFASLCCSELFAVKQLVQVTPNGTTFSVDPAVDGMVLFTIIRDPADAREPQNKSLILVRSARLEVSDGKRTLLSAPIAPHSNNQGKLIYRFRVLEEHAPHTVFTLSEIEDGRDRSGYMGGGTIFKYTIQGDTLVQEALGKILEQSDD